MLKASTCSQKIQFYPTKNAFTISWLNIILGLKIDINPLRVKIVSFFNKVGINLRGFTLQWRWHFWIIGNFGCTDLLHIGHTIIDYSWLVTHPNYVTIICFRIAGNQINPITTTQPNSGFTKMFLDFFSSTRWQK